MHRIQYSIPELKRLYKSLDALHNSRVIFRRSSIALHSILHYPFSVFLDPNPEEIYDRIRAHVLHVTDPNLQTHYQTMYHTPYIRLPEMVGHDDPAIQAIITWRLELGK